MLKAARESSTSRIQSSHSGAPPFTTRRPLSRTQENIEMLTPVVSRRAASAGISTAQALKKELGRSFTAISRCGILLQTKGKSSAAFAYSGQQDGSQVSTISLGRKIFARPFHVGAIFLANCDWSRPCDCAECRSLYRSPICKKCEVNPTAYEYVYEDYKRLTLEYISYCEDCTERIWAEERKREENNKKIKAAHEEKVNKMLEHVKSLPPGEQVPIAYAVGKVSIIWADKSAAQRHKALRDSMSEELKIVKVENRWRCDKGRVDAMDFELWRDRFTVSSLETNGYRYGNWLEYCG